MKRRWLGPVTVAAVAAAVSVTAGCSDDGSSPESAPSTSTVVTTTVPPTSAVIGAETGTCFEAAASPAGDPALAMTDITEAAGLVEPLKGLYAHAVAPADVNGDGWVDLFVGTFADRTVDVYQERGATGPAPDRLLLGGPDGFRLDEQFEIESGRTSGAAFADLDADGDPDLVISRNVRAEENGRAPSVVLRNDGGHFEIAQELDDQRGGRSIGVADFDADGRLDLVLVEDKYSGGSTALFRNAGGLEFVDATRAFGLPDDVQGLGVTTADLTADGRPDLLVAGSNRLFVNRDGTLDEVDADELQWETYTDEDDVAGIAVADLNRDGRPDLLVGQHYQSTIEEGSEVPVRMYLHEGVEDGVPRFRDVTEAARLPAFTTKAPHVEIVDVDADGWPDLLVTGSAANGDRPAVLRSLGVEDGVPRFAVPGGIGAAQYWIAGATFDSDRDGRLEIFLVEYDPALPSRLLEVEGGGHWLEVGDGHAGGSVVDVYNPGGLGDPSQLIGSRETTATVGFSSGSLSTARFGLGDLTTVDVSVRAPGQDPIELPGLAADRRIAVGGGVC